MAKGRKPWDLSPRKITAADVYPLLVANKPRETITSRRLGVPRMTYQDFMTRLIERDAFLDLRPVVTPRLPVTTSRRA